MQSRTHYGKSHALSFDTSDEEEEGTPVIKEQQLKVLNLLMFNFLLSYEMLP